MDMIGIICTLFAKLYYCGIKYQAVLHPSGWSTLWRITKTLRTCMSRTSGTRTDAHTHLHVHNHALSPSYTLYTLIHSLTHSYTIL